MDQPTLPSGRCHWCGYTLTGLPLHGACPECGKPYTPETVYLLTPWPSALSICWRIGWPLVGLGALVLAANLFGGSATTESLAIVSSCLGYVFLLATPINGYFTVRRLLKRHLPEGRRTKGTIAALRSLGTVLAVVAFLCFLAPLIALGACLVMMSSANF